MARGLRHRFRGGARKRADRAALHTPGEDSRPGGRDGESGGRSGLAESGGRDGLGDGEVRVAGGDDMDPGDHVVAGGDDGVDPVDDAGSVWLAYELHEWASESRTMLAQLLIAEGVVHSWQGATVVVHESSEHVVDLLVDEVKTVENLELDPAKPQTAFDMQGWSGELQARLSERLGVMSIPHEFDSEGDLVCHTDDEEQIDSLFDELLAQIADEGLEELEGLEANDLLSALFGAADRLCRDLSDTSGVRDAVRHGRRLAETAAPFGFSASNWATLRARAAELADLIESGSCEEADLVDLAVGLRDALRQVI